MSDEADSMGSWENSQDAVEFSQEYILNRRGLRDPLETVRFFPKRKHTHPTSPRKSKK